MHLIRLERVLPPFRAAPSHARRHWARPRAETHVKGGLALRGEAGGVPGLVCDRWLPWQLHDDRRAGGVARASDAGPDETNAHPRPPGCRRRLVAEERGARMLVGEQHVEATVAIEVRERCPA